MLKLFNIYYTEYDFIRLATVCILESLFPGSEFN